MPAAKPPAPRKRQRKRKRRAVASSSSSSDSDSDSSSGSDRPVVRKVPVQAKKPQEHEDESSSSSSSSEESEDSESARRREARKALFTPKNVEPEVEEELQAQPIIGHAQRPRRSPSPDVPPHPVPLPSFLPETGDAGEDARKEQELKERFRKLWMSSIADAFKDDLEVIQKEPNMNPSRLAVLIESLASGADVFSSSARPGADEVNEMQIVLDAADAAEQRRARCQQAEGDVDMADEEEM
ncbi:unnamed protein product [Somion occarium]|uniref:Ribosome assembly protein 3 n=1 Tax=Somion occarium TaxID=3059160 RepID=A0ABP1DK34_9APHY